MHVGGLLGAVKEDGVTTEVEAEKLFEGRKAGHLETYLDRPCHCAAASSRRRDARARVAKSRREEQGVVRGQH